MAPVKNSTTSYQPHAPSKISTSSVSEEANREGLPEEFVQKTTKLTTRDPRLLRSSSGITPLSSLIPVINQLHDVLISSGADDPSSMIALPQIAVVGAQSVGKTSVLESLVGRDFLPRGSGIVTRRPLLLQLCHIDEQKEWAEFNHRLGVRYEDFDDVRDEIQRATDRFVGSSNKSISPQPIGLKIYSPNVIDLTLIDLPGVTKVPVGNQPPDIEQQTRKIVLEYIEKPSCIILAVSSANADIANSDSLQLARTVDPEGYRTIGVITKLDLVEEGSDALHLLTGQIYPLRLGYVGVVCRNQREIDGKVDIQTALDQEHYYFRTHSIYKQISTRCGTRYLGIRLNEMLMDHIKDAMPELRTRISNLLEACEEELAGYGDPILEAKTNPGALLLHFFSKFARNFQDAIDGRLATLTTSTELMGGARINYIFHDWFGVCLSSFSALDGLTDAEIRIAIRNATGPKASLFVPEGAFEMLVKKQISKLREPAHLCVDQVYNELQKIVEKCELPEMSRYENLKDAVLNTVCEVLRRCVPPTKQMIENLIQIELAYLNTNHPDFGTTISRPTSSSPEDEIATGGRDLKSHERRVASNGSENINNDNAFPPSSAVLQQSQGGFFSFLKGTRSTPPNPSVPDPSRPPIAAPNYPSRRRQIDFSAGLESRRSPNIRTESPRLPKVPAVVSAADNPTEREFIETELIKNLIVSYFSIVRKNISDLVPKAIMFFMVNTAKEVIQRELVSQLYREDKFDELLREGEDVAERREQCKEMLKTLRRAQEIIAQIREHNLVEDSNRRY